MMTEEQLPFVAGSKTSQKAAESMAPIAKTQRERVLRVIQSSAGLTDQQIANILRIDPNSARPRRVELLKAGLIKSCGKALTASGREATVWIAIEKGK